MASFTPRPSAQRGRASHSGQPASPSSQTTHNLNLEDSETVIIDSQAADKEEEAVAEAKTQAESSSSTGHAEEEELPKCWICFQDPSEDDPLDTSPWRHPCPCALTAHEACLLDWIADKEAPTGTRRAGSSGKIQCPQCKSEIKLSRPRSVAVDVYRRLETLTNWAVFPGLAIAGSASLGLVSQWHGIMSIYQVFGPEDAYQMLRPLTEDILRPMQLSDSLQAVLRHWRLLFGPTLIPPILILSRTTMADSILPIIPMIFFATKPDRLMTGSGNGAWPPSAALSFALLPYIRGAYNTYYERVWSQREQEWLKQIRPRTAADAQPAGGNQNPNAADGQDGPILRIEDEMFELEVHMDADWEEEGNDGREENQDGPQAHPLNAPPQDGGEEAAPAPDVPDNRAQQEAQAAAAPAPAPPQRNERNPVIGFLSLTRGIAGALLFPTIAASMGEILKVVLPVSWVTLPILRSRWGVYGSGPPSGILQTRWGRSLVGGCLFVVIRDAMRLYVRWKMANMHRQRKVLDFDGPRAGSTR